MEAILIVPLVLTLVFGGAFVGNEMTHGGFSELMGLGHHHMTDVDEPHCWGPSHSHPPADGNVGHHGGGRAACDPPEEAP